MIHAYDWHLKQVRWYFVAILHFLFAILESLRRRDKVSAILRPNPRIFYSKKS